MNASSLSVSGVGKEFGDFVALADISLQVEPGELVTLLGPSGSGKTTLLNSIAGFVIPERGRVQIGAQEITHIPTSKRDVGIVFQNYALFPHMTVKENIAFPLKMRGVSKVSIEKKVANILDIVELSELGNRMPAQLSGGQQQRVALARAIVFDPVVLLLDEPFSALDRKLREQIQVEVKAVQQRLGLTTIFVTHDQEEALIMSDRIAIMKDGRIEQVGTPDEVYSRPQTHFVAQFVGQSNLIDVRIVDSIDGAFRFVWQGQELLLCNEQTKAPPQSETATLLLRPEHLSLGHAPIEKVAKADNSIMGMITSNVNLGATRKIELATGEGTTFKVQCLSDGQASSLVPGEMQSIHWSSHLGHILWK